MSTNPRMSQFYFGSLALILFMLLTRSHHFSTTIALPDASLAVFFFAGLWFSRISLFVALLALAVLIDYVAITHFGVSDFCISQAYIFLLPTYSCMWLTGKWCQKYEALQLKNFAVQITLMSLATTAAFIISNGSFYLWSGRYPDNNWDQYFERVFMYYPPYLSSTFIYVVTILTVVKLIKLHPALNHANKIV